jgi:hypothetical protein
MNSLKLKKNKMKYLLILLLTLGGCTTTEVTTPIAANGVYYQAFDENWAHDPGINPIFETKAEAGEYAKRNNMGDFTGGHSYEVRVINYRYVVRVGFSDYTYSNGSWNDILHTAYDFNDAYEYVVEYSSAHSDLVIFDLKTGKSYEETP